MKDQQPEPASLTKEVNLQLSKHLLVFNGRLANHRLTSLVKEAADQHCGYWWPGASAPGHQQPQCWVHFHAFLAAYKLTTKKHNWKWNVIILTMYFCYWPQFASWSKWPTCKLWPVKKCMVRQILLQPAMPILSLWWHFHFSAGVYNFTHLTEVCFRVVGLSPTRGELFFTT